MWYLQQYHRAHGGEGAGKEFRAVDDEGGFEEVDGAERNVEGAEAGEVFDEGGDHGDVRVQFDLAGEVDEDEVFFGEGLEGGGEEVEVFEEESVTQSGLSQLRRKAVTKVCGPTRSSILSPHWARGPFLPLHRRERLDP